MPRYTRAQVQRRRRIAAAILAALVLLLIGGCSALIALVAGGGSAHEAGSTADPAELVVPTTAADAPALAQLPAGDALAAGEVIGIDVSAHQGAIDWEAVRGDGIAFAYVKATEGVGHADARFDANWKGADDAGIARGAYHYFTLCSPGAAQAEAFLAAAPPDDAALPPVVDLELDSNCTERPTATEAKAEVDAFVAAVEKGWGRRVVVYSSREWRDLYPLPEEVDRPRWATSHGERPDGTWQVWQVRFDARVDGIDGDVDLDVLKVEELRTASALVA